MKIKIQQKASLTKNTINKIQIFGERCCGTNYLEHLLLANLEPIEITSQFGFKHCFHQEVIEETSDCLFVIIYRNPLDWLRAMHKTPYHAAFELRGIPFEDFIRKEWWCQFDEDAEVTSDNPLYGKEIMLERCPLTHKRFTSIMRLRTAKINNYESLKDKVDNSIYITLEELRTYPGDFINIVSDTFKIRKSCNFADIIKYKGIGRPYIPTFYYPITVADLCHIMNESDIQLEESIGYDIKQLVEDNILQLEMGVSHIKPYTPSEESDQLFSIIKTSPVYRFWIEKYLHHFYTISENEKNDVIAKWPDVWKDLTIAFYAYPPPAPGTSPVPGTLPVYRFWNEKYTGHFYTISENEKNDVIAKWPDIWKDLTIAFYAYPANSVTSNQQEEMNSITSENASP
jgi:hypothetical protein